MAATMKSSKTQKLSKKNDGKVKVVKASRKVTVIRLRCPNCGEEEEKVLYCPQCDGPMVVVEVVEKDEDEIQTGVAVDEVSVEERDGDRGSSDVDLIKEDPDVEKMIEEGALADIFPGAGTGEGAEGSTEGGPPEMDMDEIVEMLDKEE